MDLSALLEPMSIEDFFTRYWGKCDVYLQRGDSHAFDSLRRGIDLETVIWRERGAWGDLSLARANTSATMCPYLRMQATVDTLAAALDDGYTIVVNNLQRKSSEVAQLCRAMEKALFARCTVNLYLTGPGCQGLDAHYDDTDVFVLQIDGNKTWRVREGGRVLPLGNEEYLPLGKDEPVRSTYQLKSGDLLYIPRGVVHEAKTTTHRSVHLTVSVSSIRWVTLFERVLQCLAQEDTDLRHDVWLSYLDTGCASVRATAQRLALRIGECLTNPALITAAICDLRAECIAGLDRLPAEGRLTPSGGHMLSSRSMLRHATDQLFVLAQQDEQMVLHFVGGTMCFEPELHESLRFVVEHETFKVCDIPGKLEPEQKIGLATRCLELGLLDHARNSRTASLPAAPLRVGAVQQRQGPLVN